LHHSLHEDSIDDLIFIEEGVGIDGDNGSLVKTYLRSGKELILSGIEACSDKNGIDELIGDLTALVCDTEKALSENMQLEGIGATSILEIELLRLIHKIWKFYDGDGKHMPITILSLKDKPKAYFDKKPAFNDWVKDQDSDTYSAWFRLSKVDFDKGENWKAYLINSSYKKPMSITMNDPQFLEKLRSKKENEPNGLLVGDLIRAQYCIEYNSLEKKTNHKILHIENFLRADEMIHQEEFDL